MIPSIYGMEITEYNFMNKTILILNLIVKTLVEIIFICTFGLAIGIIVFIGAFIVKNIKQAIKDYRNHLQN